MEVGVVECNYNHKVVVVEKSHYNDKVVVVEENNYNENNYSGLQNNYHTDSHTPNNYFHHNLYFLIFSLFLSIYSFCIYLLLLLFLHLQRRIVLTWSHEY